ncbi:MAG TPA: hypothetical protein VFJ84_00340 [Candidatus Saccharimonadales bacterium]|nr:hypothetical protein [Candidatus Saccharimonadales bacterium]
MSTIESETTRVVHDGVVYHAHFWYGHGEPPAGFFAAAAFAEANTTVNIHGSGNGSGPGTTTYAPPYPPMPAPAPPYGGFGVSGGLHVPRWAGSLLAAVLIAALAAALAILLYGWAAGFNNGTPDTNVRAVQVSDFMATRGVNVHRRIPASYTRLADGNYLVTVHRNAHQVFHLKLSPERVNVLHGKYSRMTAALVYNHDVLFTQERYHGSYGVRVNDPFAPHSGGSATRDLIDRYNRMPIAVLARQHLRVVVIRAPYGK